MASYGDILQDIHDALIPLLTQHGLVDEASNAIAAQLILAIQKKAGGSMTYVPKHTNQLIQERNKELLSEFTGNNQDVLARKYSLSMKQVYEIIRLNYVSKQVSWIESA